jgi:hypothetical protein
VAMAFADITFPGVFFKLSMDDKNSIVEDEQRTLQRIFFIFTSSCLSFSFVPAIVFLVHLSGIFVKTIIDNK